MPRFCSSLPFIHSVIRPTTGSGVAPNSVELASSMPQRFRAASITAICMPKQMPKYGTLPFARELRGADFAFGAALAEAARHQDAVDVFEERRRVLVLEHLALDPVEIDLDLVGDAAVRQRLDQRFIGVLHAGIFADDGDGDVAFRIADALVDESPGREIGLGRRFDAEGGEHFAVETAGVIGLGHRIDVVDVERLDHGAFAHVAEQRELLRSLSGIGRSVRHSRISG